ncbi:MAG: response regulator, partial [Phycisphaeraceae bacterium]|nr:response regulator [Phycisphaeraceae bacterium]
MPLAIDYWGVAKLSLENNTTLEHAASHQQDTSPIIMVIDDDPEHLHLLQRALQSTQQADLVQYPRLVRTFEDPADALSQLPAEGPVVILCDYQMPGCDGLDWIPDFVRAGLGPVIMMTAQGDEYVATQAFRVGAVDYLVKGEVFENPRLLHLAIRDAVKQFRLNQQNHELARELKLANAELEKKNAMLSEMTDSAHHVVDDVAHEFRTPLTVIKEFTAIINDGVAGEITERQSEYLGLIDNATRDLSQMVDDFLDTSKLRVQTLRIDRQPYRPKALIEHVLPIVRARARSKNISVEVACPEGLPDVFCDIEKVGRVIINLAVNAIKFSPVESTVKLWSALDGQQGIKIGVTDDGPGIPDAELHLLCERFGQVSTGNSQKVKGYGLGLNIASDLARLNLGTIEIDSKIEHGS